MRLGQVVDNAYVEVLADAVTGSPGGSVGVAPRVFLKKLVSDRVDRVDQFDEFDPRQHYRLTVTPAELTDVERSAAGRPARANDVELEL